MKKYEIRQLLNDCISPPKLCSVQMKYNYHNEFYYPIKVSEMLSQLDAPQYIERVAVNNVKNIKNAKKAILKAFKNQVEGKGFSLVEVVSTCPTNWGMTPSNALKWVDEKMIPYYPLGVYRDKDAAKED